MTAVMVDSDVLIDIMTEDPRWFAWASDAPARAAITRDVARYRSYFPKLALIAPD
jgi:hypothetical protein